MTRGFTLEGTVLRSWAGRPAQRDHGADGRSGRAAAAWRPEWTNGQAIAARLRAAQQLLNELGHGSEDMREKLQGMVTEGVPVAGVLGARDACNRPGQPRPRRQGTTRQPLDPDPFTNGGRFWSNSCRIALLPGESSQPVTARGWSNLYSDDSLTEVVPTEFEAQGLCKQP